MLLGRDLLVKKLGWVIGDGMSINIRDNPWLSLNDPLRPMGPPSEVSVSLKVADLFIQNPKEWDQEKIRLLLPKYEQCIKRLKPSCKGTPDKLVWLGTKTGCYTTKSGYYAAVNDDENKGFGQIEGDFSWKKNVWNQSCAPKIKVFAWKILKGALPVGVRLLERHIVADHHCKRCGAPESIIHLFFQCRFAQQVWRLAPFTTELDSSGMIYLGENWTALCEKQCLPPAGIVSGPLFLWVLWALWKARNRMVFDGYSGSPEHTLSTAIVLAHEWSIEHMKKETIPGKTKAPLEIAALLDSLTVRSAAWANQQEAAGLGWAIFSTQGIQHFMKREEWVNSALMAEGIAMREAICFCAGAGMTKVKFESDSLHLVKMINAGAPVSELYGVVADILSLMNSFEFVGQ